MLGPPLVDGDGALAPRDRTVLGVLAVRRGQVVTPDQVADAVWGERPPSSWPTQVQICIGRLRKALGASAIETIAGGYRLTLNGDEVDVDRFEQLVENGRGLATTREPDRAAAAFTRALGLWRGRPFEDLDGWEPGCSEAARLEELRRSTEEELLDARLAAGEQGRVAAAAEALVAAEPLRERRWATLALAQYRCGRQADALRSLARARALLVDQLGIDPGSELVALEAAILRQDEALAAPEPPPALTGECPYKGLAAYDVGDADVFFGRDQEVAACLERLRATPLLVVAGPSGCGKSSLVGAGLLPALGRGGRSAVVIVPGSDADGALSEALSGAEGTPVVVVDQFEALFTLTVDPDVARAFCQRISRYAHEQAPVVICVRADHLTGLSIDTEFARLAEQGLHLVSPLSGDGLREAIEQPASQAGYRLEHGLVDLLVRDTEGEPGALPLLSHALVETWRRRDGHVLTVEGYRESGGIRGAVARSADRLYDNLPAEQRAMLRGILLRLVAPSVDGDPVRCRVPTRSLVGDRQRERVVALLVRARLVTAEADTVELAHEALARAWPRMQTWLDEDAAGLRILRHLATAAAGWDTLGRADSELYRGARLDTALEWRSSAHPDLTAAEITFLDASVAHAETELAALEARARRDARQNRRLRGALVGVALLAVASLVAGVIAFRQGQRAETSATEADAERERAETNSAEADAQRQRAETNAAEADAERQRAEDQRRGAELEALTSNAVALRSSDPDLAALLAVEAHRLAPSTATESALFGLFTAFPGIGPTVELEGGEPGSAPLWLPDSNTIVVGDTEQAARLIDLNSGRVVARLEAQTTFPSGILWLSASADGRYLAAVTSSGDHAVQQAALTVWDLQTREQRFADVAVPINAGSVAINADGSQVAVAGGIEARTFLYDAATGQLQRELDPIPRPEDVGYRMNTVSVEYAPDGRLVVTSQAGPIRFIEPATGDELGRIEGHEQTSEADVVVDLDGGAMTTSGRRGVMRYALPSGLPLWTRPTEVRCDFTSLPIVQFDALLCPAGGRMIALDLDTGTIVPPRRDVPDGAMPLVSPDGTTLLLFSGGSVTSWRLDGGGLISTLLPRSDGGFVTEYSPDGATMLVNTTDAPPGRAAADAAFVYPNAAVEIVGAGTGEVHSRIEGAVLAHFTDDPRHVVALFADRTIGRYDLIEQRRLEPSVDVGFAVEDFVVSGDRLLVWGEYGLFEGRTVTVDVASGVVAPLTDPAPGLIHIRAPTNEQLYTEVEGVVQRRDPSTGAVIEEVRDVGGTVAGEEVVVVHTFDGEVLTLDPDTLAADGELSPAPGPVAYNTMDLSDDDARLFVRRVDGVAALYDLASRTQLGTDLTTDITPNATYVVGAPWMIGAAIRGDGGAAAMTTDEGIVVWDLDPARWSEAACELASRNLTHDEWDTYIGDLAPYRQTCPSLP